MKTNLKPLFLVLLMGMSLLSFSQTSEIKLNPEKVKKFITYVEHRHGGKEAFPAWKETNKLQYAKEMWYFSESFYIKRNHLKDGVTMDESLIDISRFENMRKANEEAIVEFPGYKDVIVLLPANQLLYKPN